MVFVFDWSDFGSANGSTTLIDGADALDVTVTSDSNYFVSSIEGSDVLKSSNQTCDKSTVIAFDQEVENVSFELFDIDQGSSSTGASTTWDDQITFIARDADGNIVPIPASAISDTAHHSVTVNLDGSITVDSEGNDDRGVEGSGAIDTVSFNFAGPIASIEIVHQVGDDGAGNTGVIGVSNLTIGAIADVDGDNIVDGTSGDDVMLVGFVDADDDTIDGADGDDDTIFGHGGDDTIEAGAGVNTIFGGTGDDVFIGGEGADSFQGNSGQDNLDYSNSDAAVNVNLSTSELSGGDADNDTILGGIDGVIGSDFDDVLTGFDQEGTDPADTYTNELFGGAGDDIITGLDGDDVLDGGTGDDEIYGGGGDDEITGGAGNDVVEGGDGDDVIDTSGPNSTGFNPALDLGFPGLVTPDADPFNDRDIVDGGAGNDTITTGDDADTIFGGTGDDVIDGGIDADSIDGGDGNDTIIGGEGSDVIDGGAGDDVIYAALDPSFPDSLNIPDDIDPVLDNGDDLVHGGSGNDTIYGADDNDELYGDSGNDVLFGGIDEDMLFGGTGDDALFGGDAADTLEGGEGSDLLDGGRDDDTIIAGAGDAASGGHGDDVFTIDTSANDTGATTLDIVGGETGEANQADNADTTNDDYPGAPNDFGDVLDLTNLFADGLLNSGDITYDDPSHENGNFTYTNDDGDDITVNFSEIENVIVCFTRGTMIVTDAGEKAIEDLVAGDMVMTKDHGLQEMRWIGSRIVPAKDSFAPIMIKAGAMANDRDLLVSPQHRMVVEGWKSELLFGEREVLAAAKHLVNNDTIYVQSGGMVEYFHMLFDTHEIVFANGAASESFHPGEVGINALSNEARDEIYDLFPELRDNVESYGSAARTSLKGHEAKVLAKNPDFLS